ncbi:MAG: MIP/aquaporin family protein [Treponema sp.]
MSTFLAELVGTAILILLGDGVVAGCLLTKSKAENAGWIVITLAWGLAVTMGVYAVGSISGAHLNPAVTVAMAVIGNLAWTEVVPYIAAQMIGAFLGAVLVWLTYLPHWKETDDPGKKLGIFATGPAIYNPVANVITEVIGAFMLLFGILFIGANDFAPGVSPLAVGLLIVVIGMSLGGPTGYAINPARDLGPRIAHAVLPIPGKGDSQWYYAWVPVVGPIIGGVLGALAYKAIF